MITIVGFCSGVAPASDGASPRKATGKPVRVGGPRATFSIIGSIDVDGDGISDRKLIHEHLAAAGASIDIEVDDHGVRRPKDRTIDSRTAFLVVGTLVDPATIADPAKRKIAERVAQHYLTMRAEARKAGVRAVFLQDFWSYGSPRRNRWVPSMSGSPGEPYRLKRGAYQLSRRLKQLKSTGKTSKLFRGASAYDQEADTPD